MKLVVFGSTGRTGLPLVQQALDAGHDVVAFLRTPAKMTIQHQRLTCLQGDAMNAQDVQRAITSDVDAVLMVLGHTKTTPRDMQTVATRHVIEAMKAQGVQRLISLTGGATPYPEKDQPKLVDHIFTTLIKLFSGDVLQDAINHAGVIRGSGLQWTIVRGPRLTEGAFTGEYRVGYVGVNASTTISRADLAHFILQITEEGSYIKDMPFVSD